VAIRIVKRGVDPKTLPFRVKCPDCETIFELLDTDATPVSCRDERSRAYWVVDCPVCVRRLSFDESSRIKPED
jgi:endogenous inhibitor of DNA gyrase (YacG/DUF329 family)